KEEVAIPYRRIHSVGIKQSLLHRLLGVGRVVISTTTDIDEPSETENEANDEVVPLMDYSFASAIANKLTGRAEVERMQLHNKTVRR
ncbi:MAG: PH domain-containing protein, partial [Candidatus Colwellbacteria bacterium]|nr:PH domain-containing protein [Candidatus Colwellbacteria bacterium]